MKTDNATLSDISQEKILKQIKKYERTQWDLNIKIKTMRELLEILNEEEHAKSAKDAQSKPSEKEFRNENGFIKEEHILTLCGKAPIKEEDC